MRTLRFLFGLTASVALCCMMGCRFQSKEKAMIVGQFPGAAHTRLYLIQLLPASTVMIDSAITDEKGHFSFTLLPRETSFYQLQQDRTHALTLAVNKGETLMLTGKGGDFSQSYELTGSDESQVLWEYHSFAMPNRKSLDSLSTVLNRSQSLNNFKDIRQQLDSLFGVLYEKNRQEVILLILKHITSISSIIVANQSFGGTPVLTAENDFQLLDSLDQALSKKYRDNTHFAAFHERVSKIKAELLANKKDQGMIAVHAPAPPISLPDAGGKAKKLSALKGKLTLVYFWSSWNEASREMNQGLTGVYEQFHPRGFEIYGVSLDTERKSWTAALRKDRTAWIQVNDSSGLNSAVAKEYGIRKLPCAILLDKEGRVISADIEIHGLKALLLSTL